MPHFINLCSVLNLGVILFIQTFKRPLQELWENGVFFYFFLNGCFQITHWDIFPLGAIHPSCSSGAVVVGVFPYFASALDELFLGFCGVQASALATPNRPCKSKLVLGYSWFAFSAKQRLHSVIFFKSDYWFVCSLILHSSVFYNSCVEQARENLVNAAS